ncbi:MFS transporter [Pontibacillus sp. HMF3514]|uniref:MFS transporter n=1 Tax=Pontibacillus sp. HMF3514 TaxID=2692425 RepID=UPI00131FACEE|nr:MFS transporter [Pontibacillus sp. HMF3514]QHE51065.1 MFS transporter [Pontibacillus sp. HMF3514]
MEEEVKEGLFRNKPYLYLIASQIVSNLGDWLDMLALMALVAFKWNASPMEMSGVMLCIAVPMILFGPIAGVYADKFDRKKLMILSDIIRAIVVIGFVFATSLWHIYVLLILKGMFGALFVPAKNGKLKEIVSDDHMQQAMGISAMINNGSKIVGPMLSGVLVSSIGVTTAFYIDSFTFILSALLLIGVPKSLYEKDETEQHEGEKETMLQRMNGGLNVLKGLPVLFYGLFILSLAMLAIQIADSQIMILLRLIEGDPVDVAGYAMAASGAGVFIMSAIWSKKQPPSLTFVLALGLSLVGVSIAITPFLIGLPMWVINLAFPTLFFMVGAGLGSIIVPFNVGVQKATPVQYSGRVFGTINSMTMLATIIGMLLGGVLSQLLGVTVTFIISGALLLVVGLSTFGVKKLLESRDPLAESDERIQGEAPSAAN